MLKLTIRRILPAIVLLLSSATSHALDFEDGTFTFSTNDDGTNTCTITGTKLSSGGLTIPSTASNNGITYTVTQIGTDAFRHKYGLTGPLIIPEGITRIGMMAFIGCSGFTELKLPKGLKIIESMAFYECNGFTGELQIPEGIELIDQHAFEHCSRFSTLILPEGLTSIGDMTFIGCSGLTEIKLPEGLTNIGASVFAVCRGLTERKL
ncbi:MAG: leucine-rich repeat domain-containing protein, partial [Paramuribaculum sp.]|nr:leucine-rich repeat domain-containing protein [Paramuribaculum sp.]